MRKNHAQVLWLERPADAEGKGAGPKGAGPAPAGGGAARRCGGACSWRNPRERSRCCEGNWSGAGLEAFSAQLVPAGENGGGWGGAPGAVGGLVYPAFAENFWPGCQ